MYSRTEKTIEVEESIDLSQLNLFNSLHLDPEVYQQLIDRGDDINALSSYGLTPLMLAARYGNKETVALLIHAGANLNCKDEHGFTALHNAFRCIEHHAIQVNYTYNPYFSIISMLYSAHAEPLLNKKGNTPLMSLCQTDKTVEFCINEFSQYEAAYYSCEGDAYKMAIEYYYRKSYELLYVHNLITSNSDNERRCIPRNIKKEFLIALETNNISKVRILLDSCPELDVNEFYNERGLRPLSIVIYSNRHSRYDQGDCRPLLALLIKRGADVNLKNKTSRIFYEPRSALEGCAVDFGINIRLMLFFIENGAKTNFLDEAYLYLIRYAISFDDRSNNQSALEWLLHYCGDIINRETFISSMNFLVSPVSMRIFDKFMLDPNNAIDVSLNNMTSIDNVDLILYSFRYEIYFYARHSNQQISFLNLFHSLIENDSLSYFSKNRLTYILKLHKKSAVRAPSYVDPVEFFHFSKLLESLYEAVGDINRAIASAVSGFKDTGALQSLSLWRRKQNPNPVIAAVAQREFDRVGGLVVCKRQ